MVSGLRPVQWALDPPQGQLRQNHHDAPPPLRRQRLPNGPGMWLPHGAIQASARPREAPCSPESATRRILSTYKRHLLWDIEQAFKELKNDLSVRPIRHQLETRIEAHIFVAFLAYCLMVADSDEAGHAFQIEAGHLFRSEAGRGSDLKPATQRMRPRIEAMMFRRGGLVKRAWVSGLRGRRRMVGL